MTRIKMYLGTLLCMGMLSCLLSSNVVGAEKIQDQAPVFSGTSWMQVKEGDSFDEKEVLSRVYAMDYEDGDLTQEIEVVSSNVNTNVCGEYMISYRVTDTAGNTCEMYTQVSVVSDYDEFGRQVSKKLYTKENADHLLNAGVYRGYYHDRQHLGVYLPKYAYIHVRIANAGEFFQGTQENLTLDLFADDSSIENSYVIPSDGSWLSIAPSIACVPFVRTPQSEVAPVLVYYVSREAQPLTYYHYGDDQRSFSEQWAENEHEFAVLDSERMTMLVPRKDREVLPGEVSAAQDNAFQSLDEMLLFYKNMQERYDEFIGISYQAEEQIDKNIRAKYFLKADAQGVGAAYYNGNMYIAQNADTIKGYLGEDYWMSLHEVAHGYDGEFTQGDLEMGEMINNILAHYYERTLDSSILESGGNGWGYLQNISLVEDYYQQLIDDQTTYSAMGFDGRLYCFLNLLNKTDAQKMMSNLHKEWRRQEGKSVKEFVVEQFCRESGYNLIPYFESIGISVSDLVRSQIYEENYPVLTAFARNFDTKEQAQESLQLLEGAVTNGKFGLVDNEELAKLNFKGTIKVQVEIDDLSLIKGRQAVLLDGEKEIAAVKVESAQVVFENVPIGEYRLKLPAISGAKYYVDYQTVKVVFGAETEYQVIYHKANQNLLKDDMKIQLLGLADQLIAEVTTNIADGKITVTNKTVQPHYYFSDVYTSVKVLDTEGQQLYEQAFIGNQDYTANEIATDAPVGSVIEIYHKEIDRRMKVVSDATAKDYQAYTEGLTADTMVVRYIITENGLKRMEWDADVFEQNRVAFFEDYAKELEKIMGADLAEDSAAYQKQKAELASVIRSFSAEKQRKFWELYPYLTEAKKVVTEVFGDVNGSAWYVEAVQYVYDRGIMSGNEGLFKPEANITRAQVVTTLYNMEGRPQVTDYRAVGEMIDVQAGQWYTDAVCWAYSVGVANGNSYTKMFNMNDPVTRQQLATFFYNYAEFKGFDTKTKADISGMAGADAVASYALNTMKWAVGTGLIKGSETIVNGVTVYDLKPTGTATRAQMSAILQRFCEGNQL